MNRLRQIYEFFKMRKSLRLVVLAAVLLQVILAIQHYYTHRLLEKDLDRDAERELIMKAVLVKGILTANEAALISCEWSVRENLQNPDSVFNSGRWILQSTKHLDGCGIAFVPNYYPSKGRLYELYVNKDDETVRPIAGPDHDYTQMEFYRKTIEQDQRFWSDPYINTAGNHKLITTFSLPVHAAGKTVAVMAIDMPVDWMSDTIDRRHNYPSSFNLLLTEDGKPIVQPGKDHVNAHDVQQVIELINDSTVKRSPSTTGISTVIDFTSKADGSDGRIYYANMKGRPHWQLVVVCYDDEVYHDLNWMTLNLLMLILFTLGVFAFIVRRFAVSERKLQEAKIEQERIGGELRVASTIQQSMLPHSAEGREQRDDVDAYGMLRPAKEVGGDLYEYFIRDEKLFFCIGDVSGKGVPSSLVMAVTQAIFLASAAHTSQPASIMRTINQTGCRNNERNMFVTLFIGVLDLPTGRLRYCNAGHDTPLLMTDDGPQWFDVKPNLPLGVIDDFEYAAQECLLPPGATLLLYTDGVTEAMDEKHNQFGRQRLLDCLMPCNDADSSQLVKRVVHAVDEFVNGAVQSDDLTMLAVRYTPSERAVILDEHLALQNDVSQVPRLNEFVDSVAQQMELDKKLQQQLKLAVEEAVVNVMQYAYPIGTTGDIDVNAQCDGEILKFIICDRGKAFDPTQTARADTSLSVEDRPIGGLGILLVRELMDSINYERVNGRNLLTLRKKLK
jgi:sigma-B regulation protein RsbU (phosphoserine phosphatase)